MISNCMRAPSDWRIRSIASAIALCASYQSAAQSIDAAESDPSAAADTSVAATGVDTAQTPNNALEEVLVTSSRIARSGFTAPTPVTVLGLDEINRTAPTNLADAINTLPAVRPSLRPSSNSNNFSVASGNFLDLRGLGATRTLVLVDGKRFVPSLTTGPVNINAIPQALIERVEIVTGGASAAWGSDAVAGVVNLILDDGLEGFKASVQGGISDRDDDQNYLVSMAYGARFGGGRGKLLIAGDFADNRGVAPLESRGWGAEGWQIIPNPAFTATNSEPRRLLTAEARTSDVTVGGLINSGPLRGIQFGPGGQPMPFRYGTSLSSTFMVGGDGVETNAAYVLEPPLERGSAYSRLAYEMSEALSAYVDVSYGKSTSAYPAPILTVDRAITIRRDNAFLPTSIRDAMTAQGLDTFTMGRFSLDHLRLQSRFENESRRIVAGLEGSFGEGWTWDAYYTHGENDFMALQANARINSRFNLGVDAVIDPATGGVVCRSTLSNPGDGCVPVNLFGEGSVSQAALGWMMGASRVVRGITQNAAALTLRGEPISTWAGPVSLAAGAEHRRESADVTNVSTPAGELVNLFTVPWSGDVDVSEGFAELVVPLASGRNWAESVDLNLAGRITDYSTAGRVNTWKGGLTYEVNESVRLRATRSRDIRAPSLEELFAGGGLTLFQILDPATGQTVLPRQVIKGNPNLQAEVADTTALGFVLTPSFISGLRLSLDVYEIEVNDVIIALSPPAIVDRCFTVQPQLCSRLTRDANGQLTDIDASPENLAALRTQGADFELAYTTPLDALWSGAQGDIQVRGLVNYVDTLTLDDGTTSSEYAGSTEQPSILSIGGVPHWRFNVNLSYDRGPLTLSLTERYVGGGKISNAFTSKDLNILETGGRLYTDLSAQVELPWGDSTAQLFAVVNNALDQDPPITGAGSFGTTRSLYDVVGRAYALGLRFHF